MRLGADDLLVVLGCVTPLGEQGANIGRVVAVVSGALSNPRPRRRYEAPVHFHAFIFLHWLLPDGLFERLRKAALK